jgi:transcriptional regulator with GAF, ATPase, and Fis domain
VGAGVVANDKLVEVLKTFARTMVNEYAIDELLDKLCKEINDVLEVDGAGVMLEDEQGALRFVAASDDLIRSIESLQIELGEGPCLRAYQTGNQVLVNDLAVDEQFPRFSVRALEAGMAAVHSFPLVADATVVGALNVYATRPAALDEPGSETGQLLADIATTYILNARNLAESHKLAGQLQRALDSRVVIEQAKGKLSEQLDIAVTEAFEVLRRHARSNGRKLHDVAVEVMDGTLHLSNSSLPQATGANASGQPG